MVRTLLLSLSLFFFSSALTSPFVFLSLYTYVASSRNINRIKHSSMPELVVSIHFLEVIRFHFTFLKKNSNFFKIKNNIILNILLQF